MKYLLIALLSTLVLTNAGHADTGPCNLGCEFNEAYVKGKIKSVDSYRVDQGTYDCYVTIQYEAVMQPLKCPLHITTVKNVHVDHRACEPDYKVGDPIDGVLMQDQWCYTQIDRR